MKLSDDPASMEDSPAVSQDLGPFLESLGVRVTEAANGRARVEVIVDDRHLRSLRMMHGGMTATLLDTALGIAAYSLAPASHYSVTIQLDVKYTRPAIPRDRLIATASVQHAGRRTAVSSGELRTATGALIATGSATLMYLPIAGLTGEQT